MGELEGFVGDGLFDEGGVLEEAVEAELDGVGGFAGFGGRGPFLLLFSSAGGGGAHGRSRRMIQEMDGPNQIGRRRNKSWFVNKIKKKRHFNVSVGRAEVRALAAFFYLRFFFSGAFFAREEIILFFAPLLLFTSSKKIIVSLVMQINMDGST